MVKNKALPDSAPPVWSLSLSFSLSPSQTWPYQGWSHVSFSLGDAVHPEGTPWILPRLDPGKKEKTKRRTITAASKQLTKFQKLMKLIIKYCINAKLKFRFLLLNDILVLESKL